MKLGKISNIVRGSSPRPQGDPRYFGGSVPRLMIADVTRDGMYVTPKIDFLTELGATQSRPMKKGDVIIAVSGDPGRPCILRTCWEILFGQFGYLRNHGLNVVQTALTTKEHTEISITYRRFPAIMVVQK